MRKEKFFNILLVLITVILVGYLAREIIKLSQGGHILPLTPQVSENSIPEENKKQPGEEPKPYSYYSQEIGQRELFKSSVLQGQEKQSAASLPSLKELSANLTILGIILDDEPQVIIEDTKAKKSYFLSKGDFMGEIKVEDILESKVILSYQDEKIELVP